MVSTLLLCRQVYSVKQYILLKKLTEEEGKTWVNCPGLRNSEITSARTLTGYENLTYSSTNSISFQQNETTVNVFNL